MFWLKQLVYLLPNMSFKNDTWHFYQLSKVTLSCLTLCDPVDCSPPGSSVHGILQARIQEWVAIPSPGGPPDPGIELRSTALQDDSYQLSHREVALT